MAEELLARLLEEVSLGNTEPRRVRKEPLQVPRPRHIEQASGKVPQTAEQLRARIAADSGRAGSNPFTALIAKLASDAPPQGRGGTR